MGLMTLVLAYFIVVTIAGLFRAWVAKIMGDNTPEKMGFLSFNPLVHTDPIGFFFLLIFRFGWGRYIPINPFNIVGRFRIIRLFLAYVSDTFIHLVMATVSLVTLIVYFGLNV